MTVSPTTFSQTEQLRRASPDHTETDQKGTLMSDENYGAQTKILHNKDLESEFQESEGEPSPQFQLTSKNMHDLQEKLF